VRYKRAVNNVLRKGIRNVCILYRSYLKSRIPRANFLYCVNGLEVADFKRWNREIKTEKTRIVTFGPPPVPIKPTGNKGVFFLTKFPYDLAKTPGECFESILGSKSVSWNDFKVKFNFKPSTIRELKREFDNKFKNMKCKGCNEDIDEGFIIHRDEKFIVNHALQNKRQNMWPFELGHLVLMPRKRKKKWRGKWHPVDTTTLNNEEWNGILKLLPRILKIMRMVLPKIKKESVEHIYIATFNESEDWHLHIHLVPRYKCERRIGADLLKPRKLAKKDIDEVVRQMRKKTKQELTSLNY